MKTVNNNVFSRRTVAWLLSLFVFCSMSMISTSFTFAQTPVVCGTSFLDVEPISTTDCNNNIGACCYKFTFTTTTQPVGEIHLSLPNGNGCWLLDCGTFVNITALDGYSYSGAGTLTHPGTEAVITFSPALNSDAGAPHAYQVQFTLCPKQQQGCNPSGGTVSLDIYDDAIPPNLICPPSLTATLTACNGGGGEGQQCSHCNITTTSSFNDCYEKICYKQNNDAAGVGPFRVDIIPPASTCNHPVGCNGSDILPPSGWTNTTPTVNGLDEWFTVTPPTSIDPCSEFCVLVKKCSPAVNHYVRITELGGTGCYSTNSPASFKQVSDPSGSGEATRQEGNYPNPLTVQQHSTP
jgi:hypothetical protein